MVGGFFDQIANTIEVFRVTSGNAKQKVEGMAQGLRDDLQAEIKKQSEDMGNWKVELEKMFGKHQQEVQEQKGTVELVKQKVQDTFVDMEAQIVDKVREMVGSDERLTNAIDLVAKKTEEEINRIKAATETELVRVIPRGREVEMGAPGLPGEQTLDRGRNGLVIRRTRVLGVGADARREVVDLVYPPVNTLIRRTP